MGKTAKKNWGQSVGKIKKVIFDSQGQYFLKNMFLHGKHRRKTRNV